MGNGFPKQIGGTWSTTFGHFQSIKQGANEVNLKDYPLIQLRRTIPQPLLEPKSNNSVTFPIRCAALLDAIPSANKHIKPYEND